MTDLAPTRQLVGEPITDCRSPDIASCSGLPSALPHPDEASPFLTEAETKERLTPEAVIQRDLARKHDHLNNCGTCQRSILQCYQRGCSGARAGLETIAYAIYLNAIAAARRAYGDIASDVEDKFLDWVGNKVWSRLSAPSTLAQMSNTAAAPLTVYFSRYMVQDAKSKLHTLTKNAEEVLVPGREDPQDVPDLALLARDPSLPMGSWDLSVGHTTDRDRQQDTYAAQIEDAREAFLQSLPDLTNTVLSWVEASPDLSRGFGKAQIPGAVITLAYLEQIRFFITDPAQVIDLNKNTGKAKQVDHDEGRTRIPTFSVNDREVIRLLSATGESGPSPATLMRFRQRLTALLTSCLEEPDTPSGLSIICAAFTQTGATR